MAKDYPLRRPKTIPQLNPDLLVPERGDAVRVEIRTWMDKTLNGADRKEKDFWWSKIVVVTEVVIDPDTEVGAVGRFYFKPPHPSGRNWMLIPRGDELTMICSAGNSHRYEVDLYEDGRGTPSTWFCRCWDCL